MPVAMSMPEAESALVRVAARRGGDGVLGYRLAGGRRPLFPFTWALRRAVCVKEELPAAWAAAEDQPISRTSVQSGGSVRVGKVEG